MTTPPPLPLPPPSPSAPGRRHRLKSFLFSLTWVAQAAAASAATIQVFAAASLSEGLREIASAYQQATGEKVLFNFAASSFLARQIEEGAPADLFFSADEARMDELEKKALIIKETRRSRLSNSLVIVVAAESSLRIDSPLDLTHPKVARLTMADPKIVPAGVYAREYFHKAGLWSRLEPKVIPCDNVRAALAAVEAGNADAGMVYKTDAAISRKVKVAYAVPAADGPKISYPVALLKDSKHQAPARQFWNYLLSPEAGKVFARFGFLVR